MTIKQIYTGCIAHAAYYLESNGEAAIFDPLREVQPYIDRATADKAKIKYVFETHFHADFVSGHLDLAKKTGATIVYGPTAKPGFTARVANDGEVFNVGADTPYSVNDLAREVCRVFGVEANIRYLESRNEVLHAYSSHEKVRRYFPKTPTFTLSEGLEKMGQWAREHGPRKSQEFGEIEIERNLPPSWRRA